MNIKGWKYYNHAMIPTTAPHESVNLKPLLDGSIWKMSGRKPLLARWTSDFDCGYEKEWWYCIKDTPFDISQLKSKHRYEINKGNKNYYFKKINSSEYMEELWDVTEQSFTAYPQEYRPSLNKEKFILEIADWNKTYTVIAVFNKTSDELCGYALLKEHKSYVDFSVLKAKPEYEKSGINAAIVFAVINEYNKQLEEGGFYICDGCRNILHETNFQNYLEKYFGFRKAFCTLNIEYRKDFKLLVKMLYPLRGMFKKLKGKLSHQISSILFMEELNRKM